MCLRGTVGSVGLFPRDFLAFPYLLPQICLKVRRNGYLAISPVHVHLLAFGQLVHICAHRNTIFAHISTVNMHLTQYTTQPTVFMISSSGSVTNCVLIEPDGGYISRSLVAQ